MRVEPPLLEQPQRILGHRARSGGPCVVGLGSHPLHVNLHPLALRSRDGLLLAFVFGFPLVVAEPANGGLRKGGKKQEKRKKERETCLNDAV